MRINHKEYLKLAFNLAKINLGKTASNPSVGCVVVKDKSVISSGYTSINGRPHAEFNALKINKDLKNTNLYVTMEPCVHYGLTPPCTNLIIKKGIKNVFYGFNDIDPRSMNKSSQVLNKKKINVKKIYLKDFKNFYDDYFLTRKLRMPLIDAKIAISKDYYTINRNKNKWITNVNSRNRVHLLRSEYDCILSTSESINLDNSLLNVRLNGLEKGKPDLVIIDLKSRLKKNLKLFKQTNRRIYIVTLKNRNLKKKLYKKKNIKLIYIKSFHKKDDFINLFKKLNILGFKRIFVETGLRFLRTMIKNEIINNLYVFQSSKKLKNLGYNNISSKFLKKIRFKKRINVNLEGDNLYKIDLKNV